MSAKIYITTHTDFESPVKNKAYQILDMRKNGDFAPNGLRGSFYSELLGYKRIVDRKILPKVIGFCGYRKYFSFMDDVPDLEALVAEYGCITTKPLLFTGGSVRTQYQSCLNVEDLDIVTRIIDEHMPDFASSFHRALEGNSLHACNMFIMSSSDAREMINTVWSILDYFLEEVGLDIDKRIRDKAAQYMHLPDSAVHEYQYRMGGHLAERIISAWIDWKFPDALQFDMVVTGPPAR